uniref:class I SAM-dependent methyltransferase n=1 Tax=Salmonella enterica TaxID=28901 RepID=UPI00329703D5
EQIKTLVTGKRYVDVGSGMGGILDLVKPWAKEVHAVEPQKDIRNTLERLGYNVHASIASLASQDTKFDLVTLFHVFEHLTE